MVTDFAFWLSLLELIENTRGDLNDLYPGDFLDKDGNLFNPREFC